VAQFEHLSPENDKNHESNDRRLLVSKFGFERAASKEQTREPTVRPAAVYVVTLCSVWCHTPFQHSSNYTPHTSRRSAPCTHTHMRTHTLCTRSV